VRPSSLCVESVVYRGANESLKSGSRHTLLLYKRVMDRLWKYTLVLGLLLFAIWF
jgi:hypothetical protein